MKKWYIKCPYCDNEIKEWAKKCQYCHEFLDKSTDIKNEKINTDESKAIEQNISNQHRPRYKNVWVWIFLWIFLIVLIYNIGYRAKKKDARDTINNYYDTIIEQNGDVSDLDFNEYINAGKTIWDDKYSQETFDRLDDIRNNYDNELNRIWDLYIEKNVDLKNVSVLREVISNWEAYKSANDKYDKDVSNLIKNIEDKTGESDTLKSVVEKISELVKSMNRYADVNIELYSYILTIQDDFYIDDDDNILFYDTWDDYSMDKFNELRDKWWSESDIFLNVIEDYENFMVEYAEKQKTKRK